MANFSSEARLTFQTVEGAVQARWQNFTIGQSDFYPFDLGGLSYDLGGSQQSMTVTFPATRTAIQTVENAITGAWLVEAQILVNGAVEATFIGEVIGGGGDDTAVTIEVGSSLDPVNAQVPPRVYSPALVGTPPLL